MDEDAGMTTPEGAYLQQRTGYIYCLYTTITILYRSWLPESMMSSFAEPSPAVERSAKSHYMQRRINACKIYKPHPSIKRFIISYSSGCIKHSVTW